MLRLCTHLKSALGTVIGKMTNTLRMGCIHGLHAVLSRLFTTSTREDGDLERGARGGTFRWYLRAET